MLIPKHLEDPCQILKKILKLPNGIPQGSSKNPEQILKSPFGSLRIPKDSTQLKLQTVLRNPE